MNSLDKYIENSEVEQRAFGFNLEAENRMRAISQNGNDGLHYEKEERKATPVFSGCIAYFPNALKAVSKCSLQGQLQHNPDKPLAWDRSKSGDELDALARHLIDHSINPMDNDGVLHAAKVAWRALAFLEKYLENK